MDTAIREHMGQTTRRSLVQIQPPLPSQIGSPRNKTGAFSLPQSLQPAVSALIQITPANQKLVINLIQGLADRENVPLPSSIAPGFMSSGLSNIRFIFDFLGHISSFPY